MRPQRREHTLKEQMDAPAKGKPHGGQLGSSRYRRLSLLDQEVRHGKDATAAQRKDSHQSARTHGVGGISVEGDIQREVWVQREAPGCVAGSSVHCEGCKEASELGSWQLNPQGV